MKYFLDTEFIEAFHKPLFGKRRHFIDLISIGIVAEDGREYFAISREYDVKDASDWVRQNVINPLYCKTVHGDQRNEWFPDDFHRYFGKSNKQIAQEIIKFVNPVRDKLYLNASEAQLYRSIHNVKDFGDELLLDEWAQPEFYGYYADYDWVLFCSLFETMMDLPKGFPMYCNDLKQTLDSRVRAICSAGNGLLFEDGIESVKSNHKFPAQTNEHDALEDARWVKKLYEFLQGKMLSI